MGWVYVLINPSMNGIYKVGMTDNSPENRARELSNTTSVASPFIVIFKHETNSYQILENKVHKRLAEYRLSKNREFFRGDPSIAIKLILELGKDLKPEFITDSGESKKENLYTQFEEEALDYLNGTGNKLQDLLKAKEMFEHAQKLGSKMAIIELVKLEMPESKKSLRYQGLKNASLKKLNKLREEKFFEANLLLWSHYASESHYGNCAKLLAEILDNSGSVSEKTLNRAAFELGIIAMRKSEWDDSPFMDFEWDNTISKNEAELIFQKLEKYQKELLSGWKTHLSEMYDEKFHSTIDYDISCCGAIALLGIRYNNNELIKAGQNLKKEEIRAIESYESSTVSKDLKYKILDDWKKRGYLPNDFEEH
jgi:hypothetical protein